MNSELTEQLIFYAATVLQLGVAAVLLCRKLYRKFPLFSAYTALILLRVPLSLILRGHHPWGYFYAYWGGEVLSWALCLAAIQEAMHHLLKPYPSVRRLVVILFHWGGTLLIAFALLTTYTSPGTDPERLMAGILVLERSVRIVQVGLLSLVFVLTGFLRLRWPQPAFGITVGFAIFATIELAAVTVRAESGYIAHTTFAWLKPFAFLIAQAFWLYYLARPERVEARERPPAPALAGWDAALTELLRR